MAEVTLRLHFVVGRRCTVCHDKVVNLRECTCKAKVESGVLDILERRIEGVPWDCTVDETWIEGSFGLGPSEISASVF